MKTVGWLESGNVIVEMSRSEWMGLQRGVFVENFDNLGERTRLYRRALNVSLREFAKQVGSTASTLSRVERGETPTLETAVALVNAMARPNKRVNPTPPTKRRQKAK